MARRVRLSTRLKIGARRAGLRWRPAWSRVDLLTMQDRWWVDQHGVMHDVGKIDAHYRRALIAYFERNAYRLEFISVFTRSPRLYEDDEVYDKKTLGWLRHQPLYKRLVDIEAAS